MKPHLAALASLAVTCVLTACATTPEPAGEATATATGTPTPSATPTPTAARDTRMATSAVVVLAPASASLVSGRLSAMPMGDGVHFTGEIGGLGKGETHAIHIHEKGDCSAADASSAGGHFNPGQDPHGRVGAQPHHAGDMNNITADRNGVAKVDVHAQGVTLGGGGPRDIIGKAVVVHAKADDYRSQPSGAAGDRIACGIIQGVY